MCRTLESIEAVSRAADELRAACQQMCGDDLSAVLHKVYDAVLSEGLSPEEQALLAEIERLTQ